MKSTHKSILVMGWVLWPHIAVAETDFFQSITAKAMEPAHAEQSPFRGEIEHQIKLNLQSPKTTRSNLRAGQGINQVRSRLYVEWQHGLSQQAYFFASVKAESDWLQHVDESVSWRGHNQQVALDSGYFDQQFENGLWLRIGKQAFAWGEAEGLTVLDVLSPTDQREPGQAELRDVRKAIPAIQIAHPLGKSVKLTWVTTHEAGSHQIAEPGDPFDITEGFRANQFQLKQTSPATPFEYAVKLEWQLNGSDLRWIAARVNDNTLALDAIDNQNKVVTFSQQRTSIYGLSANRAVRNWLVKGEIARWLNTKVSVADSAPWQLTHQTRAMLGVEYSGLEDWFWGLEYNLIRTNPRSDMTKNAHRETGFVLRVQHTQLNERLKNQIWLIKLADLDTHIVRWETDYSVNDQWRLGVQAVLYEVNDEHATMYPFRGHDSLNGSVTYMF